MAGLALVPGAVEVLSREPQLDDELARQVRRFGLAALLLPEADQGCFVAAHDDAGIGTTDEVRAIGVIGGFLGIHAITLFLHKLRRGYALWITNSVHQQFILIDGFVSTENVDHMTPSQCRGARALLDMTQPELATAAGLGLSTIVDFEKGRRPVSKDAIQAIYSALKRAGVDFIDENGGGPGVRLRKRTGSKKPK
jgi:DNA-binding XRE family transcriptional regulator